MTDWRGAVGAYLTPPVREALLRLSAKEAQAVSELRLRAGRPVTLCGERPLRLDLSPTQDDLRAMADAMLGHAAHTRQEELRQGFVTLPGGHRAGLCGRAAVKDGRLLALQDIASLCVRIAREVRGAADALMPWLLSGEEPVSALIVSPPGFGKTTLLRDAARQLSDGGLAVTLVDERSEIAACARGVPTLNVGENTDVLDGCPKAEGMRLALRAMNPRVLVTDELGGPEDAAAVAEAARCGVTVLASAHGRSYRDLSLRPPLQSALSSGVFERVAVLTGVGRIGAVLDGKGETLA